jgi:acyl-CoA thioesterase-1
MSANPLQRLSRVNIAFLALFLCLLNTSSDAVESQAPVMLVLGDSLSAAYGLDPELGWVNLLARRLSEQGYSYRTVNASITGDTTQGGRARLPRALAQHRPAIVIIELGGNDGLRGINPERVYQNLSEMTRLSQQRGAIVLLLGIRIPENYGKAYTQRFEAVYPRLSEATGAPLVPFLLERIADQPGLMQADGIHPSAAAQPIILDNVWLKLEPLVKTLMIESESTPQ